MIRRGTHSLTFIVAALLACSLGACSRRGDSNGASSAPPGDSWPQFRGLAGQGLAPEGNYPLDWDFQTGRGVAWKIDLKAAGHSSPIVCRDRLFLTGKADGQGHILCFACADGAALWDVPVGAAPGGDTSAGLCAPTPATDGLRVYALLGTGEMVCVDFAGKVLWRRRLCDATNSFGLGSSPVIWHDRVIVQLDQGNGEDDGLSVLVALDAKTGQPLWSVKRPVPNSWSTPLIIPSGGGDQVITCANPWVIAYDPATGRELWRAKGLGGEVVPMPVYAAGVVLAANENAQAMAIRPDGNGDVSATHVAWTGTDGLPGIASPITDGRRLLLAAGSGELTCYNVKTGEVLWRQTAEQGFCASPVLAGKNVYLLDQTGRMLIFELADKYALLAGPSAKEEASASPAFSKGRIYIRTKTHLYAIGKPW